MHRHVLLVRHEDRWRWKRALQLALEVAECVDGRDSRRLGSVGDVDLVDQGVSKGAANEHRVGRAGPHEVVYKVAVSRDEAWVFAAGESWAFALGVSPHT